MTRRLLAVLLVVAGVGAACNDDGRDLADAPPPTPPPSSTPIVDDPTQSPEPFTLASPAFDDGGDIAARFTCDGEDVFPPLTIAGAAPAAVELAIVVVDESADGYVHWVVAGLPASTTALDPGQGLPDGAVLGTTTGGVRGWEGPCPPPGDDAHRYRFTVYAFAEPVGMEPGLAGRDAEAILSQTAIGVAELTGRYTRAG